MKALPPLEHWKNHDMKLPHRTLLLALILSFFFFSSSAQFRKYSNEFLNIGAGARGLSMGSAQVATVEDGTAGYWNPAGLVGIKNYPQINLMHAEYFGGIGKYDFASVAFPSSNNKRVFAVTGLRFAVDDIINTLFLVEPDGSLNYNNIQEFSSADYAFLLSYAQQLKQTQKKKVQFGLNAKIIHRSVGKFAKAWGFGLDAGFQIIGKKWRFGASARDVTTTFNTWSFSFTEKEKQALYLTKNEIPIKSTELTAPRLILGVGRKFNFGAKSSLLVEADLDLTFDGKRNAPISTENFSGDPKLGFEFSFNNVFFLRTGINNFQKALADADTLNRKEVWIYQPSVGAGFKIQNLSVDYAFTNLANQSNPLFTHVFSLRLDIVKGKKNPQQ